MARLVVLVLATCAGIVGYHYGAVFEHARDYKKPPPNASPTIQCNERERTTWMIACLHAAVSPAYCEQRAADLFCTVGE
jgi:hypothetical protein